MRIDCHIHSYFGDVKRDVFLSKLHKAGLDGGIIFSHDPDDPDREPIPPKERMENVLEWTRGEKYLFPFYYIDAIGEQAIEEVDLAASLGIKGFKIICNNHYPSDPRAIPVYKRIAEKNLPIIFHSGILYDGRNFSGNYNRPTEFEILLSIDNLRFALAHISWPWTDECIAVYGKFSTSRLGSPKTASTAEMFLDTSPGTPFNYRKQMLERLLLTGYDVEDNIIWGVDTDVYGYETEYALDIQKLDDEIFEQIGISKEAQAKIYYKNTLRFLGIEE